MLVAQLPTKNLRFPSSEYADWDFTDDASIDQFLVAFRVAHSIQLHLLRFHEHAALIVQRWWKQILEARATVGVCSEFWQLLFVLVFSSCHILRISHYVCTEALLKAQKSPSKTSFHSCQHFDFKLSSENRKQLADSDDDEEDDGVETYLSPNRARSLHQARAPSPGSLIVNSSILKKDAGMDMPAGIGLSAVLEEAPSRLSYRRKSMQVGIGQKRCQWFIH